MSPLYCHAFQVQEPALQVQRVIRKGKKWEREVLLINLIALVNNLYNSLSYFASHGKTHHCQIFGLIYNTSVGELQSLRIFIVLAKSLQNVKLRSVVLQKCLTRRRNSQLKQKTITKGRGYVK